MFLGGSLLQLMLPAVFVWSALLALHKGGMQLSLLWLGQRFVEVSIYAADAQTRALPLLGGLSPKAHDWYNILCMTGGLEHTPLVAGTLFACGLACWASMLAGPCPPDDPGLVWPVMCLGGAAPE
ncbi:MAG: hypothetical protein ACK41D_06240 [Rubricoccaceae bacterium]